MTNVPSDAVTPVAAAPRPLRINLRDLSVEVGRRIPPTWRGAILSVGLVLLLMLAGCGSVRVKDAATIGPISNSTSDTDPNVTVSVRQ